LIFLLTSSIFAIALVLSRLSDVGKLPPAAVLAPAINDRPTAETETKVKQSLVLKKNANECLRGANKKEHMVEVKSPKTRVPPQISEEGDESVCRAK
jgi:hypothetical protein